MTSRTINPDHVGDKFEWELKPTCRCGNVDRWIKDECLFVSKKRYRDEKTGEEYDFLYVMLSNADGHPVYKSGVPMIFCLSCGDRIRCRTA